MTTINTVLFDLDGTLLDTAPDFELALNEQLRRHQRSALDYDTIRTSVSHGAGALISLGFDIDNNHAEYSSLREELIDIYRGYLGQKTVLFEGMQQTLDYIQQQGYRWGIVTNKPEWLSQPLLKQFAFSQQAACIVAPDGKLKSKPDPEMLLHACKLLQCSAQDCLYIGDARNDITAGNRASMLTVAALFGYISPTDQPEQWSADFSVETALDIISLLKKLA